MFYFPCEAPFIAIVHEMRFVLKCGLLMNKMSITLYFSKAGGSHRSSRRKYQEQVWRLEQRVAAMSESHQSQIAGLKATVEALESRREETAL